MNPVYFRMAAYAVLFGLAGFGVGNYSAETETYTITLGELSAALMAIGGLASGLAIFKRWGKK